MVCFIEKYEDFFYDYDPAQPGTLSPLSFFFFFWFKGNID